MKKLEISQVEGDAEKVNFQRLDEEFQSGNPILTGEWQLFDRQLDAAGTYRVPHSLGFKPLDIIVTQDTAGLAYDHANFTDTEIQITTAGSGRVRFLLGRMR